MGKDTYFIARDVPIKNQARAATEALDFIYTDTFIQDLCAMPGIVTVERKGFTVIRGRRIIKVGYLATADRDMFRLLSHTLPRDQCTIFELDASEATKTARRHAIGDATRPK